MARPQLGNAYRWKGAGALVAGLMMTAAGSIAVAPQAVAAPPTRAPATASEPGPNTTSPINDLAKTPYLGWNTYYGQVKVNDESMRESAYTIVTRGLKKAGYSYVWIDGGWWDGGRDADGNIHVNPAQWPNGMKGVADYIHSRGLKAGIYTDSGIDGCGGDKQGSFGHYQQDFQRRHQVRRRAPKPR